MSFVRYIFDLIFPSVCFCCKEDLQPGRDHPLCSLCEKKLRFIEFPYCIRCGRSLDGGNICYQCKSRKYAFEFSRSVFIYNEPIASIIKAYKYDRKEYLSEWLAKALAERFSYYKEFDGVEVISYVPSSKKSIKKRGFDHIKLIAEIFSKLTGLTLIEDAVESKKEINQVELSAKMRQKNVEGKFSVKKGSFYKRRVLLIDDVSTTLSTLNEIAKVIKEDGALGVYCYTVARELI